MPPVLTDAALEYLLQNAGLTLTDAEKADLQSIHEGLAAMIDGLWLRGALSGDPFDTRAALRLANDYIDMLLAQPA